MYMDENDLSGEMHLIFSLLSYIGLFASVRGLLFLSHDIVVRPYLLVYDTMSPLLSNNAHNLHKSVFLVFL